jgi:hypothetical protein
MVSALDKMGRVMLALAAFLIVGQAIRLATISADPGKWVGLDIGLQCWSMCALGFMCLKGRMSLSSWGWSALAAIPFALGDPLANILHPWLMGQGLYPFFWGRGNDPQQSPQYARLLVWSAVLAGSWLRVGYAKKFGRDPMTTLSLLSASSVLVTSLLFHMASLWIVQDRQQELERQARAAMSLVEDVAFEGYCKAALALCGSGQQAVLKVLGDMPPSARAQAKDSLAAVGVSGPGAFAFWRQPTEAKSFNRLPSMAAAAGIGPLGQSRLWVDLAALQKALSLGEKVFALLGLCAHMTWLWGAIFLGWWHGRTIKRKAWQKSRLVHGTPNFK